MGFKELGLSDVLFTKAQQRVLSVLFGQPDRSYYGNEIVRLAGVGVGAVMRELDKLASSGLVTVTRIGNQKHYQANPASPVFDELRGIVLKTFGVADVLRQALLPLVDRIQAAFIFGSVAKGQDTSRSDIDLMIISGDIAYPDMFSILAEAENQLGRPVNPTIYSREELNTKLASGNDFLNRVLEQPKIFLMGSDDDIRSPG
jgi:predicted nucleotidyltransferase